MPRWCGTMDFLATGYSNPSLYGSVVLESGTTKITLTLLNRFGIIVLDNGFILNAMIVMMVSIALLLRID